MKRFGQLQIPRLYSAPWAVSSLRARHTLKRHLSTPKESTIVKFISSLARHVSAGPRLDGWKRFWNGKDVKSMIKCSLYIDLLSFKTFFNCIYIFIYNYTFSLFAKLNLLLAEAYPLVITLAFGFTPQK